MDEHLRTAYDILRRTPTLAGVLLALAASGSSVLAQSVIPGQVTRRVVSVSDATQSYALYVPSDYDAGRPWPIAFLMDPRGRALVPLDLFRAAAERNGVILISSYNTLSDGSVEPNVAAINAMLSDARASFSLDPRRYYLVGFSGTARIAWDFADQMRENVAGIFGASAGIDNPLLWQVLGGSPPRVAFYGTAGTTDFNYEEMVAFRDNLREWEIPGRFRFFEGGHGWPPEEVCAAALDWFTLQAMRDDRVPTRTTLVDSLYARDFDEATALEAAGSALAAQERYEEMLADYDGLHDLREVRERNSSLAESREARRQREERERMVEAAVAYRRDLYAYMEELHERSAPADTADITSRLKIAELLSQAGKDDAAGDAARRLLEQAFVQTSFYAPREELNRGRPAHALALLHAASVIKPRHPNVLLNRARAFAQAGSPEEALRALEAALETGVSPALLGQDPALAPLRDDPRFRKLVGGG